MLQQENRLKKVRDFNLLTKHGRWAGGEFLSLRYVKLDSIKKYFPKKEDEEKFASQLLIAFAVGLKIHKSAVKRNALKRRMREVVRLLLKEKKIKSGYYLMLAPKKEALEKEYNEIESEIKKVFVRAKAIK